MFAGRCHRLVRAAARAKPLTMKKTDLSLDALRIEGSLLPAEFVHKLLELKADHQAAVDYGIPPGLNLKDEIGRYWRIASALWADFKMRRQREEARYGARPEEVALKHWLVPLFTRVLGFEAWTPTTGEEIDERRFPLTHKLGITPLLLVPHTVDLDKSDVRFAPEGRRRSPHATVQEYLNASHQALWGIVCNGHTLRILRDNPSLTRPAYIEADLARIFEEERYADFVALWLLAHGTRFGNGTDGHHEHLPVLERWHGQAQETGERALEKLRDGVTDALRQLGNGFLAHPANAELCAALCGQNDRRLATTDFFKQLLRLVYRLILLHTAEDRGLLHAPNATPEQRELYARGYSANLLRERALKIRADRHADLWQGLQVTIRGLADGAEPLGLPALGGLFAADKCPDLDAAELPNKALLAAVRALCFFRSGAVLARINYRDMDTEELGSVYESLLELQPTINVDANPWRFGFIGDEAEGEARGSARKLTGSYYTPDSLVQELIKSALEPKIAEALKALDPRAALLALKVIDPAAGSGHFLLAAARRIAAEVARLDAESDIPEAQAFRHALREVVAHCIYGVDLNSLAVELCQTALWLETLEPGKPLGFLDHHVRHGNSLVGILDPAIMKDGIPDKAYTALSGDDKATCTALKKSNKQQAGGRQAELFNTEAAKALADTHTALDAMPEDTVEAIAAKRAAFTWAEADEKLARERLRADLFCAAFFAPKSAVNAPKVPLSGDLVRAAEGQPMRTGVSQFATDLAKEAHFFHWLLAFPEVFSSGGFDCVIGNPPWEIVQARDSDIDEGRLAREKNWFSSDMYEVLSGRRDLYKLFMVLSPRLLKADGLCGFILPIGFMFEDDCIDLRKFLFDRGSVVSLLHIQNGQKRFFRDVHASYRFLAITLTPGRIETHRFSAVVDSPSHITNPPWVKVQRDEFDVVLGQDRSAVLFNDLDQASLHGLILKRLLQISPLQYHVVAEFHASSDKTLITSSKKSESDWTLLKNGSFHHFHPYFGPTEKYTSFENVNERLVRKGLSPDFWVKSPRIVFRDIARNDDSRTLIPCLVPPGFLSTYDAPMIVPKDAHHHTKLHLAFYAGYLTSFLADFLIRPFVDKHIKGYVLARIPVPMFDETNPIMRHAAKLSLAMAIDSWSPKPFGQEPSGNSRLSSERVKLDAAWLRIAGISSDQIESLFDSFGSIKAEELRTFGEYRTRQLVLAEWDRG